MMQCSQNDKNTHPEIKDFHSPLKREGSAPQLLKHSTHFTHPTDFTHFHKFSKAAFTLAEVLITLAIIGIVAALTIPNLIVAYQKKLTVIRLKRSYSVMQLAIKLSQEVNGGIESWDASLNGSQFFHKYIANYVKYQNEYTTSQLGKLAPRKLLSGNKYTGTTYTQATSSHFSLIDGSIVSINLNHTLDNGMWVSIDINGLSKPNQVGIDTFLFFFSSQYGLVPFGDLGTPNRLSWFYGTYSRDFVGPKGTSTDACAKGKTGYWCTSLIMHDGWKISDDYPVKF